MISAERVSDYMPHPKKHWMVLFQKAGLENFGLYDLRRNMGSLQAITESILEKICRSMWHKFWSQCKFMRANKLIWSGHRWFTGNSSHVAEGRFVQQGNFKD